MLWHERLICFFRRFLLPSLLLVDSSSLLMNFVMKITKITKKLFFEPLRLFRGYYFFAANSRGLSTNPQPLISVLSPYADRV